MKNKVILCISIFLLSTNVNAICKSQEIKRLKTLANKVEVNYVSEMVNETDEHTGEELSSKTAKFSVEILNSDPDLKIRYKVNNAKILYDVIDNKISELAPGNKVQLFIYSYTKDPECSESQLRKETLKIPYYNSFSERKECKDNPKFSYCKQFLNKLPLITDDEFDELLKSYQKGDEVIVSEKGNYVVEEDYNTSAIIAFIVIIVAYLAAAILFIIRIKKKSSMEKLLDDLHL